MKKKGNNSFSRFDFITVAGGGKVVRETKIKRPETSVDREPTVPQLMQRLKFALVGRFLSMASEVVRMGYAKVCKRKKLSEMNLAVRILLRSAIVGDYPDYRLNFSKIEISPRGELTPLDDSKLFISDDGKLKVTWTIGWGNSGFEYSDDKVVFFIYNERVDYGFDCFIKAKRGDCFFETDNPFMVKGDVVHCWIFLVSEKGKMASRSEYMRGVV